MVTDDAHDLGVLFDSSSPLVLAETVEEARTLATIRRLARERDLADRTRPADAGAR